jgi:hypothetical protein
LALERSTGGGTGRALRSPVAIVLAAAGAGVAAVAGLPVVAIAGIGGGAYALGATLAGILGRAGGRRPRAGRERIDPFTLGEPWRLRVQAARSAQRRYEEAVRGTREGPLRERLVDIGDRIDAGVQECWRIATQANALGKGLRTLRVGELRADLARAEAEAGDSEADPRVTALRAQLGSATRMEATAADADARLTLLTVRLDEAAARAIEISLGAGTDADLAGLGSEVDEVVDQLESMRLAIDEVDEVGG